MAKYAKKTTIPSKEYHILDEEFNPLNFKVLPQATAPSGYKFYEIIYEEDGTRYNVNINLCTTKASRLAMNKHNKYGLTLIFDPEYVTDEDPQEQQRLRELKQQEFTQFEEKYKLIHVIIALNYLQRTKPRALKNKSIEDALGDADIIQDALDEIPFNFRRPESAEQNTQYDNSHGTIYLTLNSPTGDPWEKDRFKRTNFRGISEPDNDESHFGCIKKMMASSSELTPMIRIHRIGDKKMIQTRFIHGIVSDYFTSVNKKQYQVKIYDRLSNDENVRKRYEESKKKVDTSDVSSSSSSNSIVDELLGTDDANISKREFVKPLIEEPKKSRFSFSAKK